MTEQALQLPDTDWFVGRLYDWVVARGAALLVANYSRYVIDLNRPPDNAALYSGPGTGLLPEQSFAGGPLYKEGSVPLKLSRRSAGRSTGSPIMQSSTRNFGRPGSGLATPFCSMRTRSAVKSRGYSRAGCRT